MSDSTAIFWQACRVEVNDRIRNQVLVNRLTATSSKITKISRWLFWQISRLTFTCEHVQFEWLRLLYPANEAEILSKFSSFQWNFQLTSIGNYRAFASMCNWFQNKSPTHTFAVDWESWHCNWAAPCYFNGASPTRSSQWGHCLQRHLACEGLYVPI